MLDFFVAMTVIAACCIIVGWIFYYIGKVRGRAVLGNGEIGLAAIKVMDSLRVNPHLWKKNEVPGQIWYAHRAGDVQVYPIFRTDILTARVGIGGIHTYMCNFAETHAIMAVLDEHIIQPEIVATISSADKQRGGGMKN